jgi:4-amino-4-deoxy-L-arabinose transferase-like glycosyltransferase
MACRDFCIFLSVAGQRGIYILPLYPAAAILFGAWWNAMKDGTADTVQVTRWVGFSYVISGAVLLGVISVYIADELGLGTGQILSVSKKFASLAPLLHSAMGMPYDH